MALPPGAAYRYELPRRRSSHNRMEVATHRGSATAGPLFIGVPSRKEVPALFWPVGAQGSRELHVADARPSRFVESPRPESNRQPSV